LANSNRFAAKALFRQLLPDTVSQGAVDAVFPPQRLSGKKFQKIGLASVTQAKRSARLLWRLRSRFFNLRRATSHPTNMATPQSHREVERQRTAFTA
jgi:hypothetical protein